MSSEIKAFIPVSSYMSTLLTLNIIRFVGRVLHMVGKINSRKIIVEKCKRKIPICRLEDNIKIYRVIKKSLCT
jgi:hypothetical protein